MSLGDPSQSHHDFLELLPAFFKPPVKAPLRNLSGSQAQPSKCVGPEVPLFLSAVLSDLSMASICAMHSPQGVSKSYRLFSFHTVILCLESEPWWWSLKKGPMQVGLLSVATSWVDRDTEKLQEFHPKGEKIIDSFPKIRYTKLSLGKKKKRMTFAV